MRKKFLSMLLALSMIATVMANWTVAFAATENLVSLKYYKDAALTDEITNGVVNEGDVFYAALTVNNFSDLKAFYVALAYDPAKVKLVDNTTSNDVNIGEILMGQNQALEENNCGITLGNISTITPGKNPFTPSVATKTKRYVAGDDIKDEDSVIVFESWVSQTGVSFTTEQQPLVLKLKAKTSGTANFRFPVKQNENDEATYYTVQEKMGLRYNSNGTVYDLTTCNVDASSLDLTIVSTRPKLADVTGLSINKDTKVVTWDAVTGAASYNVKVTVNDGVNNTEYPQAVANTNTYTLPAEVKYGDVTVEVQAVSADPVTTDNSGWATKSETITASIANPANVKWDDTVSTQVVWDAVEGATAYEITLTKNNQPVQINPTQVTSTSYNFERYITAPAAGTKDTYIVTVKSVGGTYTTAPQAGVPTAPMYNLGAVANVTSPTWEGDTCKGIWTDPNPAGSVGGYRVNLKKDGHQVANYPVVANNAYYDFSADMTEPGIYEYTVKALGAQVTEGKYQDAPGDPVPCMNTKTVSKILDTVENIQWRETVVEWTDNNTAGVRGYKVKLYAQGNEDPIYETPDDELIRGTRYDFDANITIGTYSVQVQAVGDGTIYKNSNWSDKVDSEEFSERLADPANLVWSNTTDKLATWDAVPNATNGYIVSLYYNGVALPGAVHSTNTTSYDFTADMKLPGKYTFNVKANRTDVYAASKETTGTDEYTVTVTTTGKVKIELFKDVEGTTPVSSQNPIRVGDEFYAVISMEDTPAFNVVAVPFKFDPAKVKVVGTDGVFAAADLQTGANGVTAGEILTGMTTEGITGYPYVNNTDGIVGIQGYGDVAAISGTKELMTIKFVANAFSSTPIDFGFAVANANGTPYDEIILSGFEFAMDDTELFAEVVTPTNITIGAGKLATMDAPVWNGTEITWEAYDSAHVTGYTLRLYKDGQVVDTITVDDPAADFYDMSDKVIATGSYTVDIVANGDANAASSDPSAQSAAYTVGGGGSSMGGGGTTKPPVTPDKPVDPIKPVEPTEPPMEFTDIDGHWAEENILELSKYGVLDGYGDGTFRPDFGITRAEFTKLMVECLGLVEYKVEEPVAYDDTENHWAKDYIAIGTEIGIVNGIGNNLFDPDTIVTREQMAAIIYRAANVTEEVPVSTYADRDEISDYAKTAVDYVSDEGIMIGMEGNMFRGTEQTTRAQVATVLLRLLKADFFKNYSLK